MMSEMKSGNNHSNAQKTPQPRTALSLSHHECGV